MATTLKTLVVKLVGDTSQYKDDMAGAEDTTRSTIGKLTSLSNLGGAVLGGAAMVGGIALVTGALNTLRSGVSSMLDEAMAAQDVEAELNAVLRSTGGIAGVTSAKTHELADALQNVTRFEDDAILSAESMLLTFTRIGRDIFPDATEATLNLAQKFGSLDSAATMVGKALQDPIQGVTALRRVGIVLSEAQEEQIAKFMELGDVASAQRVILAELAVEFGGLARAAGETAAGQIDIFNNRIGALKERVGTSLLSLLMTGFQGVGPVLLGALEKVANAATSFLDGIAGGIQSVASAFETADIAGRIDDISQAFGAGGGLAIDWGEAGRGVVTEIGATIVELQYFVQELSVFWSGLQEIGNDFAWWFQSTFNGAINSVKEGFLNLGATARGVFLQMIGDTQGAAAAFAEAAEHANRQQGAWREFSIAGGYWMQELGRDVQALVTNLQNVERAQQSAVNAFRLNVPRAGLGVSDLEQEKRDQRLMQGQRRVAGNVVQTWTDAGNKVADAWDKTADKMSGYIESALSNAQNAVKGLLPDLLGGGDPFAPGANGPFENIFRAADVAAHGAASPWAEKLGLDQATAAQIVSDFSKGLITDQVKALINVPQLVDAAKMAALAEQMKTMFVSEVAKIAGVAPGVVDSLMGYGPSPTAPAAVASNTATLVDDMTAAFEGKAADFENIGKGLLTKISDGVTAVAESLISNITTNVTDPIIDAFDKATAAVENLIAAITRLRDMNATPPVTAGGPPPGTGGGGAAAANRGGVNVVQHFHGQVDYATVRAAAADGVYAASRRQGYRW